MSKEYILKLTPNKKEVIINTSVLMNGYPDVSYPILYEDATKLKYLIDKDTYKFIDSNLISAISKEYPVSLDINTHFEDINFYDINELLCNTGIIFNVSNPAIIENMYNVTYDDRESDSGSNTEGINKVIYDISVNVNWSDNKIHNITPESFEFDMTVIKTNDLNDNDDNNFNIIKTEYKNSSSFENNTEYAFININGNFIPVIPVTKNNNIIDISNNIYEKYESYNKREFTIDNLSITQTDNYIIADVTNIDGSALHDLKYDNKHMDTNDVSIYLHIFKTENVYNTLYYQENYLKNTSIKYYNNDILSINNSFHDKDISIDSINVNIINSSTYYTVKNSEIIKATCDTNILTIFRDSANEYRHKVADIIIKVRYKDPETTKDVSATKVVPLYQSRYLGPVNIGFPVKLADYNLPIDIWSPTLTYEYMHVDDANPKVDFDTDNIIKSIIIDGSLYVDTSTYKDVTVNRFMSLENKDDIILVYTDSSGNIKPKTDRLFEFTGLVDISTYYFDKSTNTFTQATNDVSRFVDIMQGCTQMLMDISNGMNIKNIVNYISDYIGMPVYNDASFINYESSRSNNDRFTHIDYKRYVFNSIYAKYYIDQFGTYRQILNINGNTILTDPCLDDSDKTTSSDKIDDADVNQVEQLYSIDSLVDKNDNTITVNPSDTFIGGNEISNDNSSNITSSNTAVEVEKNITLIDPYNEYNYPLYSNQKYETDASYKYDTDKFGYNRSFTVKNISTNDSISNYIIVDNTQFMHCINNPATIKGFQMPVYAVYPVLSGMLLIPTYAYKFDNPNNSKDDKVQDIILTNVIEHDEYGNILINVEKLYENMSQIHIRSNSSNNQTDNSSNNKVNTEFIGLKNPIQSLWIPYVVPGQVIGNNRYPGIFVNNTIYDRFTGTVVYGTSVDKPKYNLSITDNYNLTGNLCINGSTNLSDAFVNADPYIFSICLNEFPYTKNNISLPYTIKNDKGNVLTGNILITNDEGEKHLHKFEYTGKDINNDMESFMLLRANPKLSGNVKLVVDSDYNLYIDTFKSSDRLNDSLYRKYPVSAEGNYPRDIRNVFKSLPISELYKTSKNSLNAHKIYTDYADQFETIYEYGAETNTDVLYSENMRILAPLHIGKNIPEFFTIFRYDGVFNEETYNNIGFNDNEKFKSLLKNSTVVNTIDLRQYTSIGQYLNNYKDMMQNFGYGQCGLQFIEQDNDEGSESYRQGKNIWKGILVKQGILGEQTETSYFANKILNDPSLLNKQELFNNYIQSGFERHGLLYPNIINLEFMFNDSDNEEYTMHRYFGLYLYENDFINYNYITDLKIGNNNVLLKYDNSGNLYKGDNKIFNNIFTENYTDRIFYAVSNDVASRVFNEDDINNFLTNNVKNKPEYNIISVNADRILFTDEQASFMTLHINKPIQYGEHIRFVLMNVVDKSSAVSTLERKSNDIIYNHIVYDIIASNDERLQYAENNINPYITTNICDYNNSVIFNRISFYTQDILHPEISATIEELIKRIIACISKIDNSYITVSYHNKKSISIISSHNETYVQHIATPDLDAFTYDYLHIKGISNNVIQVCTTSKLTDSINYITDDIEHNIEIDNLITDNEYNYLTIDETLNTDKDESNTENNLFYLYVEQYNPDNIINDNISYFNNSINYNMKALSNNTHYYDSYYVPFSLYEFESLGWRHSNIVKFINVEDLHNTYVLYNNIAESIKNITTPLVYTVNDTYETTYKFNIQSGNLSNNIINSHIWHNYSIKNLLIIYNTELASDIIIITNPFNSDYDILCSNSDILLTNNVIRLYKPKSASISVMGICNIKDIDMNVETITDIHRESRLCAYINANETILLDESDVRIQQGVMYQVISGQLYGLSLNEEYTINQGDKFIAIQKDNNIIVYFNNTILHFSDSLTAKTDTVILIIDKQKYQEYDYTTSLPEIKLSHFFSDVNDIYNSDLMYPVVPLVNCSWKSTGLYLDDNNVIDTNNLNKSYETIGHFTESVFTPDKFESNQYVINKLNNILYIDGINTTYKDCILNKKLGHSIKKLLINDTNIKTAVCHYNSNTFSLEFIYFGIKFVIKFNDKLVNTYIHLDSYNNYEVFVLNEYDRSKVNEMFISVEDEFILLVNHQFYIDYAHEADNNIKSINNNNFVGYAPYSTFKSPITVDFTTGQDTGNMAIFNIKEYTGTLMLSIDKYNLWSSLFILEGNDNYVYSPLESIMTHNNLMQFMSYNNDYYCNINNLYDSSVKFAYIMTKADGDYNTKIHKLLTDLNNPKLNTTISVRNKDTLYGLGLNATISLDKVISSDNILTIVDNKNSNKFTINEQNVYKKYSTAALEISSIESKVKVTGMNKDFTVKSLESIQRVDRFNILLDLNLSNDLLLSNKTSEQLLSYIDDITRVETPKEKQLRYIKSITDNIDLYVIPENSDVKVILNRIDNNPLMFNLSIPNYIKYNYGWVIPNTNNMVEYDIDDLSLSNIIDTDLLCANTKVSGISRLINYTGNKVYNTSNQKVKLNYFTVPERSLLSSTWDNGYYRLYTGENSYDEYDGLLTGIDDKSFFGSKCMVIKNPYIQLDTWRYDTANDLYSAYITDSEYNTGSGNQKCFKIEINISNVLYHYFINNKNFADNWIYFKDGQYTGMKNYINYTMVSFYNFNSDVDLLIFKKDTDTYQTINIIETNNPDPGYVLYENYKSSISFVNNEYILTIIIDLITGMDIHPVLKIYKK